MSYAGLGSRWKDAAPDATGNNTGNFTTQFTAADIGVKVPWFELYRAVATNVAGGTGLTVMVGDRPISAVLLNVLGEWDPTQPPLLQPGQDLNFYWSAPAVIGGQKVTVVPRVTIWLRYDLDEWGRQ